MFFLLLALYFFAGYVINKLAIASNLATDPEYFEKLASQISPPISAERARFVFSFVYTFGWLFVTLKAYAIDPLVAASAATEESE